MNKAKSISLYIHFPWCIQKCPYCDFNSHEEKKTRPESAYIDRLILELEQKKHHLANREITTIFIGGGTPSLISGTAINRLLSSITKRFPCSNNVEITLEANPGTVEIQFLKDYYEAGVNRLSFGVQSFCDKQLSKLGRIHSAQEAKSAFKLARQLGFDNINIDVMFALPKQSTREALNDLEQAIALSPEHISWYQLTIEPNTAFAHLPPTLPNDDSVVEMQTQGQALLRSHDYHQYEISAYARNQKHCRHNENYWEFGDYLGIGAGAHSKITQSQFITRYWNHKHPKQYLKQENATTGQQHIKDEHIVFEYFMNRMRLNKPISESEFIRLTGFQFKDIHHQLQSLLEQGLISLDAHLTLTEKGRWFLNDILQHFLE